MTTVSHRPSALHPGQSPLLVSRYDRAAGLLISMLILVGGTALVLFVIWLTTVLDFSRRAPRVRTIQYPGRGDHAAGFARDPDPPGLEELEEVLEEPQVETALEAVTDVASTVAAAKDAIDTESTLSSAGSGLGDSRPPGPLGEGEDVIPPWERWEIQYESTNIDVYARQLDFFKIELAAVGGAPQVDYARNLAKASPDTRRGSPKEEDRVYMTWKAGKLAAFDRKLLGKAGIRTERRIIMQFIPKEVNDQLHALEFANAPDRDPREWLRTVFGVRRKGRGYEYYIIDQLFRIAPS